MKVNVCAGTNCFLKGSQHILHELLDQVEKENLQDKVSISASFCFEKCDHGPTVSVDGNKIQHCTGAGRQGGNRQKIERTQNTL